MKKRLFCLMLFSTLLFLIPSFVLAEEESSEDLEEVAYYKDSFIEESSEVDNSFLGSKSFSPLLTESTNSTGWKRVTWWQDAYSKADVHLFRFTHVIEWEWDSTKITRVTRSSSPSVYTIGWKYNGLTTNDGWYYNSNRSYFSKRQAHFSFGTGGWDIQNSYPWISFDVQRGGSYTYSRGW
ncbi:hypothetical protein RJD24_11170 [Bacillaceae bacterium IKA-2]|nr:hypothetical protein RJD24_11170 [Bacillaceae bacterium IKA-2]